MTQWIKCSERMPEPFKNVIFAGKDYVYEFFAGYWDGAKHWVPNAETDGDCNVDRIRAVEVTHWMPLPEPPTD